MLQRSVLEADQGEENKEAANLNDEAALKVRRFPHVHPPRSRLLFLRHERAGFLDCRAHQIFSPKVERLRKRRRRNEMDKAKVCRPILAPHLWSILLLPELFT